MTYAFSFHEEQNDVYQFESQPKHIHKLSGLFRVISEQPWRCTHIVFPVQTFKGNWVDISGWGIERMKRVGDKFSALIKNNGD
jgi:cell division inhibitor SulA